MPKAKLEPGQGDILSIEGAAAHLGVGKGLVYKLAKDGVIPGTKVGDVWRFSKAGIEEWVKNEGQKNVK